MTPLKRISSRVRSKIEISDLRVIRNMAWFSAPVPLQFIAGIAQAALIARALGTEGFGVLAIYFAVTFVIFGVLSSPASETITTFVTKSSAAGRSKEAAQVTRFVFAIAMLAGLGAYIILVSFTVFGGQFIGLDQSDTFLLVIFGTTGVLTTFQWEAVAILRLADKMKINFLAITTGTIVRIIILAVTLASGWRIEGVVAAYVASAVVTALIFAWAAIRYADHAGIPDLLQSTKMRVPKEVFTFQLMSFGRSTIKSINRNIDVLLLSNMLGIGQLGIFRAAKQITDFSKQPFSGIATGVQSEYSRKWYANEISEFRKFTTRFTIGTILISALGFGLLLWFKKLVVELVLGPDFVEVSNLLEILIPAAFLVTATTPLTKLPAAIGKAAPVFWAGIAALIVQLAVIVIAVPTYGLTGAAWAIAIYSYVIVGLTLPFVLHALRTGPPPPIDRSAESDFSSR